MKDNDLIAVEFIRLLALPKLRATHERGETICLKLITRKESTRLTLPSMKPSVVFSPPSSPGAPSSPSESREQFERMLASPNKNRKESKEDVALRSSRTMSDKSKKEEATRKSNHRRSTTVSGSGRFLGVFFNGSRSNSREDLTLLGVASDSEISESEYEEDWVDVSHPSMKHVPLLTHGQESESTLIAPKQFAFHTEVGDRNLAASKFVPENFELKIPLQVNLYEMFVSKEGKYHRALLQVRAAPFSHRQSAFQLFGSFGGCWTSGNILL